MEETVSVRALPCLRLGSPLPLLALLACLAAGMGHGLLPALALPEGSGIPLECRLGDGPWQSCRMEVQEVGAQWVLLVGRQRVEFRHDGTGAVRMQKDTGGWRPVSSRWNEDTSLCWDGVCARGDIPLD
jgi:hypothetical protein